ncbi:MAG: hypothetical protein ACXAEF_09935, partial [Candidatus Thorarchaeota archaeon]
MDWAQSQVIAFLSILCVITTGLGVLHFLQVTSIPVEEVPYTDPEIIDGLDGKWYVAGPFGIDRNGSYSVTYLDVVFTFISYNDIEALDAPTIVSLSVRYTYLTIEYFEIFVGGNVWGGPFIHTGNHTDPSVAIITHRALSDLDWHKWYC